MPSTILFTPIPSLSLEFPALFLSQLSTQKYSALKSALTLPEYDLTAYPHLLAILPFCALMYVDESYP